MSMIHEFEQQFGKKLADGHGVFFAHAAWQKVAATDPEMAKNLEPLFHELAAFIDSKNIRIGDYYGSRVPAGYFKVVMVDATRPMDDGTPSVRSVTVAYDAGIAERSSEIVSRVPPMEIVCSCFQYLTNFCSGEPLLDDAVETELYMACHTLARINPDKEWVPNMINDGVVPGVVLFHYENRFLLSCAAVGIAMPPELIPPKSATQSLNVH